MIFEIPVERGPAGHLLVRLTIDGNPDHLFLIDTGANGSIFSASVVRSEWIPSGMVESVCGAAGCQPVASQSVLADRLVLGPLTIRPLRLTVLDFRHLRTGLGVDISGILGLDVLSVRPGRSRVFRIG